MDENRVYATSVLNLDDNLPRSFARTPWSYEWSILDSIGIVALVIITFTSPFPFLLFTFLSPRSFLISKKYAISSTLKHLTGNSDSTLELV